MKMDLRRVPQDTRNIARRKIQTKTPTTTPSRIPSPILPCPVRKSKPTTIRPSIVRIRKIPLSPSIPLLLQTQVWICLGCLLKFPTIPNWIYCLKSKRWTRWIVWSFMGMFRPRGVLVFRQLVPTEEFIV